MSDNDITVSVSCLAYNHEKYIRKTLEGFVNQKTSFKYEVFVHDDASTDNTASIIREYAEKYPDIIKPIFQIENQYSQGIKIGKTHIYPKMSGRYIAFCEGDDYWCDENKLQQQFEIMEKHPECSICVHKVQCINEDGSVNKKRVYPPKRYKVKAGKIHKKEAAKLIFIKGYPFQTSSYFIRKSVMNLHINVPFQGFMAGDASLLRAALSCGDYYYIDKVMSCYRLFSIGSWSSRFEEKSIAEKIAGRKRSIEGNKIFDKYSNWQFHDYIQVFVFQVALRCVPDDVDTAKKIIAENNIRFSTIFGKCSLEHHISYLLIKISPKLYLMLRKLYRKMRGKA